MERLTVLQEEHESRLDRVLGRLLPDMGLRGRRRLCELGLVRVNGRPAAPSRKMRPGDMVEVNMDGASDAASPQKSDVDSLPRDCAPADGDRLFPCQKAHVVLRTAHLAVLFKPSAMHTETLAGKPGVSLQALLGDLLGAGTDARLLNRLDYCTSGLTVAALDKEGERIYREAQESGQTTKRYLALLEGEVSHEMLATQKLLLKNRSRVLVELETHPDVRRHTKIRPLAVMDAAPLCRLLKEHGWEGGLKGCVTLAGCTILKGARHQIRAHCAAQGFPLLGDERYGAALHPAEGKEEAFFLHHGRLTLPGLDAMTPPPWLTLLEKSAVRAADCWLKQ